MNFTGRLKWFNAKHGFGFIRFDNHAADALLHVSVLKESRISHIQPGAKVTFTAQLIDGKGWRVLRIISVENTGDDWRDWRPAVLKWFNRNDGYGFVRCDGIDEDVFLHLSVLERDCVAPGQSGDAYLVIVEPRADRLAVSAIRKAVPAEDLAADVAEERWAA